MNHPLLSVIMPSRAEFPQIVFTIHNILNCWRVEGFKDTDIEIIIVENCSNDDVYPHRGTKGTVSYLMPRGAFWNRILRVVRDPIAGNHTARTTGAKVARGDYLFFTDAHMSYVPGFFKTMLETINETRGLFHGVIGWLGAWPPTPKGLGYQYTIKVGEEWKGTWTNYLLDSDKWFYIASLGHCSVGVLKEQFFKFGGYQKIHRTYGGGELYLDMKWWMLGSTVVVHPKAIGFHLASGRGYSYDHDDYIENIMGCMYALGIDDWRERTYLNYLRKGRKEVLDKIMERSAKEHEADRAWIEKKRKYTFNELLVEQPWNKLNKRRLGKSNGHILVFHDTWLDLLHEAPQYVQEAYKNSKYQKGLEEFINNNLSQYVYKRTQPIISTK